MDVQIQVRRSILVFIFEGLTTFFFARKLLFPFEKLSAISYIYLSILLVIGLALLLRCILWPNYIEVKGGRLYIYREFWLTESFDISNLESLHLHSGPLGKSHFVLANRTMYDFYAMSASSTSLSKLENYVQNVLKKEIT